MNGILFVHGRRFLRRLLPCVRYRAHPDVVARLTRLFEEQCKTGRSRRP